MANQTLDIREILKLVPHRWPFVLIDKILSHDAETLTALKNVTYNEAHFPGHFPEQPTMPGVLIIEAMAQASGMLAVLKSGVSAKDGMIFYFSGVDSVRFRKPVLPGDQLILEVRFLKQKRDLWKMACEAKVAGEVVCEGELMCVVRPPIP